MMRSATTLIPRPARVPRPSALLPALMALCALFASPSPGVAQLPPHIEWRTIESANFHVTYSPGLDALARHTAARAEVAYEALARELGRAPRGRIEVVLTGEVDVTNGYASPFPQNRIVLFAQPPLNVFALEYQADWIELLVTHELTHIFHLDRAGAVGRALRTVFGRVPFGWPFFPVVFTPTWSIEGLAVQAESHLTGMGRLHGSYHEMVVRTAVLEGRFDPLDRVSSPTAIWPDGQRPYIYGSLFMDYLQRRHGDDAPARILSATANSVLPPPFFFDLVGRRALGETFGAAYNAWRRELEVHYAALADTLTREGLTASERVVGHGRFALTPRISPDGRRVAYAAGDGRDALMMRVVDADGATLWQRRRTSLGPASWLPDGSGVITSQLEFFDAYRLYEDLYLITERGERRLTRGARLQWPDVARDGRTIVAVQGRGDTNRLVLYDLESGATQPLNEFAADVHWMYPRWDPAGERIAVSRWTRGGDFDLIVLDAHGALLHELTGDRAIDGTPSWSPDGRYIVFSSDRTGIPNLYAAELLDDGSQRLHRMTNVLTGAVQPDVSPDGGSLVFVRYHADGFHIDRMPFDPASWQPAPPFTLDHIAATRAPGLAPDTVRHTEHEVAVDSAVTAPRRYSPWRTLRPHYWSPVITGGDDSDTFIGVATSGTDLIGRHRYDVLAAVEPGSGRWEGSASYDYAGLGRPIVGVAARREWENVGLVSVRTPDTTLTRAMRAREDVASAAVRFVRPRLRSSASVSFGGEYVHRRRELLGTPLVRLANDRDVLAGPLVRASASRLRYPTLAISPQDGFAAAVTGRRRFQTGRSTGDIDDGYPEVSGQVTAYRSFELSGFARHVLAARGAGLWRGGEGAPLTGVGGVTGTRLLAVRGYDRNTRLGTTGWAGSAEYRLPLALVGRGFGMLPVFLDRVSLSGFVDAGDIRCNADVADLRPTACGAREGVPSGVLAGGGAELVLDAVFLFVAPTRVRLGVAAPLTGGADTGPRFHVQTGLAF